MKLLSVGLKTECNGEKNKNTIASTFQLNFIEEAKLTDPNFKFCS